MPLACRFCESSDREALETALLRREKTQEEAAKLLGVTRRAVGHHLKKHIPEAVRLAISSGKATQAGLNVAQQLLEINQASRAILTAALGAGDPGLALRAIDRVEKQLELQAKLLGDIQTGVTVNVNQAPAFVEFRSLVLSVLDQYPETKAKVVERLKSENSTL